MGDRSWYYYDCPKCGKKKGVEIYDAYSCMLYVEACQYCDYKVDKDYYEVEPYCLEILTPEEARAKGIVPYDERPEEE